MGGWRGGVMIGVKDKDQNSGSPPRRSSAEGQERDETPNKLKKKTKKQKQKTDKSGSNQKKKKSALSTVVSVFSEYSTCVQ